MSQFHFNNSFVFWGLWDKCPDRLTSRLSTENWGWVNNIILFERHQMLCYPCRLRLMSMPWKWSGSVGRYTARITHKFTKIAPKGKKKAPIGKHHHVEKHLEFPDASIKACTKKRILSMIVKIMTSRYNLSRLSRRPIPTNRMNNVDIQKSTQRANMHPQGVNRSRGSDVRSKISVFLPLR